MEHGGTHLCLRKLVTAGRFVCLFDLGTNSTAETTLPNSASPSLLRAKTQRAQSMIRQIGNLG